MTAQLFLLNTKLRKVVPAQSSSMDDGLDFLRRALADAIDNEKEAHGMLVDIRNDAAQATQQRLRLQHKLWEAEWDKKYRL